MATYSGNEYGTRALFVFDSNSGTTANFITTISSSSTTGAYVAAGGYTLSTLDELKPFIGNMSYLKYKRTQKKIKTSLSSFQGGITTTISNFTPDPRSIIGVYVSGGSSSFTGDHMDEIHVSETGGGTYQGFLGKITYPEDDSTIPVGSCLLDLVAYGLSGDDYDSAYNFSAGNTLENKTNTTQTQLKLSKYKKYVDLDSYRSSILEQANASLSISGVTSATFGVGSNAQHVYFPLNNKYLFDYTSSLLPAFAHGASGADIRVKQSHIFTLLAGLTTDNYGVTFDGISGGTLGYNSEFEEFAHYVIHSQIKIDNDKSSTIYNITNKNSIRGIDQVSF